MEVLIIKDNKKVMDLTLSGEILPSSKVGDG